MKKIKYSIFIPCYNEEKCIEQNTYKVWEIMDAWCKLTETNFEIIIVDDCSKDNTKKITDDMTKTNKNVRVIHYVGDKPTRRENLIRSFIKAKGEIIAYLDADLSTNLKDLPILLGSCEEYDICIGNRYDKKSKIKRTVKRYIISKSLNLLTRILAFPCSNLQDHFIGFKAFKKECILDLINDTKIGNKWRGMWWDAEMLCYAQLQNYSIKTIPVEWVESKWTKLHWKRELKMLWYMLWWAPYG